MLQCAEVCITGLHSPVVQLEAFTVYDVVSHNILMHRLDILRLFESDSHNLALKENSRDFYKICDTCVTCTLHNPCTSQM